MKTTSMQLYMYLNVTAGRSKAMEEVLSAIKHNSATQDTRAGDTAILKVIEAYCASGRSRSLTCKHTLYIYNVQEKKQKQQQQKTPV